MSTNTSAPSRWTSSLAKEFAVGITGIMLVLFLFVHMAGNLLIFAGAETFNAYPEKLRSMGALFWAARIGLIAAFVIHMSLAASLAKASRKARTNRYESQQYVGRKSPATRFMILTGIIVLCYLILHLWQFTLSSHEGARATLGGEEQGLYGVVWNTFANPGWSLLYIFALCAVASHLSHAIASVVVTLGVLSDKNTAKADIAARLIALVLFVGFASVPVYILFKTFTGGAG